MAYKHIIAGEIKEIEQSHQLDNKRDKTSFIEHLIKDLNIENFENISGNKKNLFRIYFDNLYYNIFIEFPDGGETEKRKKIGIPYNQTAFKEIIENNERVLVMNIYIPLLDINGELDFSKRVYLIVRPKVIYLSKVITNEKKNNSSRWCELEDMLDVMNTKIHKLNRRKNVYIVYWEKLKKFFNDTLRSEYLKMLNDEFKKSDIVDFIDPNSENYNKYRRLFRERLIAERGLECEIINCKIKNLNLMIASHIKPVNVIIKDNVLDKPQKILEIFDPNNGFLLCPNHDALFDKFLISFDYKGKLKVSKDIINQIPNFNLIENEKNINISSKKVRKYLNVHNKEFKRKNKIK